MNKKKHEIIISIAKLNFIKLIKAIKYVKRIYYTKQEQYLHQNL